MSLSLSLLARSLGSQIFAGLCVLCLCSFALLRLSLSRPVFYCTWLRYWIFSLLLDSACPLSLLLYFITASLLASLMKGSWISQLNRIIMMTDFIINRLTRPVWLCMRRVNCNSLIARLIQAGWVTRPQPHLGKSNLNYNILSNTAAEPCLRGCH